MLSSKHTSFPESSLAHGSVQAAVGLGARAALEEPGCKTRGLCRARKPEHVPSSCSTELFLSRQRRPLAPLGHGQAQARGLHRRKSTQAPHIYHRAADKWPLPGHINLRYRLGSLGLTPLHLPIAAAAPSRSGLVCSCSPAAPKPRRNNSRCRKSSYKASIPLHGRAEPWQSLSPSPQGLPASPQQLQALLCPFPGSL